MTPPSDQIEPVRSDVTVALSRRDAFEFFTSHISRWWPLDTHSVSGTRAETAVFELWKDGEIFELAVDSERIPWGTVLEFDPPDRVLFSWHPGRPPDGAQQVEVTFHDIPEGTRVALEHRGWGVGEKARKIRDEYEKGWAYVLGECYEDGTRHRG